MSPLLQRFSNALKQFPIPVSGKIIVAVSGGPDSICLLHLLKSVWPTNQLHVAHLNHSFRLEADSEAEFVSTLCQSYGIACTVSKQPVLELCKAKRLSKQEGARIIRYAFLEEVAQQEESRWIAVGHTADDQAETVLINLLRGAGADGLSGIPKMREANAVTIIRPILSITRTEILQELESVQFMQDQSNQDKRYLRSRIRHHLIPTLETYNPRIKETLAKEATLLADESSFLKQQVEATLIKLTLRLFKNEVCFDLPLFCSLHIALQRRLIRWAIAHLSGTLKGIQFDYLDRILTRIRQSGNTISLSRGLSVQKKGDELILKTVEPRLRSPVFGLPPDLYDQLAINSVSIDIPPWNIRLVLSIQKKQVSFTRGDHTVFLDFDTLAAPLLIRGWGSGDRFSPLGMDGTKKLQDFFVDLKIPKEERHQIPILVCSTGIVWVIGYRISNNYRVTEKTKTVLSLSVEKPHTYH